MRYVQAHLDQDAPRQGIAGLGNCAAPDAAAGGMLAGDQAKIGHQLPWVGEAAEVANFGDDRDRHHQRHPVHRLKRQGTGAID
jgi:hypothetical protein